MINSVLLLFSDPTESVQKAAVESMKSVIEAIPKEKSSDYVPEINNTLDYLSRTLHFASIKASAGTSTPASSLVLPGFALPGGVDTVLPLYLNAMRVGSQQGRNQILDGIRSIVSLTPTEALKVCLTKSYFFFLPLMIKSYLRFMKKMIIVHD
jgi:hypothetical protein